MDEFAIQLALEQSGQANAAASDATILGKLDPNEKLFPFGGFVMGAAAIGLLLWFIRK